MKVTINSDEAEEQMAQAVEDVGLAIINAMGKVLQHIGIISARDYLHGPRPQKLDIRSGELIRAILGGPGFSGGVKTTGSPSVSSANSIRNVFASGDTVIGEIGVKNLMYADLWEKTGHGEIKPVTKKVLHFFTHDGREIFTKKVSAQGPRPFLLPAGEQARTSGKLDEIFMNDLEKIKID